VLAATSSVAVAQATTSLVTDAAVAPRGVARVRLLTSWTRYDELFGVAGATMPTQLAARLNTDSLGAAQIPLLGGAEKAIAAASGVSAFRLTAGKLVAAANSRVVTSPLILEYGVTNRLTVG